MKYPLPPGPIKFLLKVSKKSRDACYTMALGCCFISPCRRTGTEEYRPDIPVKIGFFWDNGTLFVTVNVFHDIIEGNRIGHAPGKLRQRRDDSGLVFRHIGPAQVCGHCARINGLNDNLPRRIGDGHFHPTVANVVKPIQAVEFGNNVRLWAL